MILHFFFFSEYGRRREFGWFKWRNVLSLMGENKAFKDLLFFQNLRGEGSRNETSVVIVVVLKD